MTVVTDNPVHLNVLLKSTALLVAVQTDLAVEVGVLPGPAAIHSSGTGRHLPRQVLFALIFLLADSLSEPDVTVHLARMHIQIHLSLGYFPTLITAILYLMWFISETGCSAAKQKIRPRNLKIRLLSDHISTKSGPKLAILSSKSDLFPKHNSNIRKINFYLKIFHI